MVLHTIFPALVKPPLEWSCIYAPHSDVILTSEDGHKLNYEPNFIMNLADLLAHKPQYGWSCSSQSTHESACFLLLLLVHKAIHQWAQKALKCGSLARAAAAFVGGRQHWTGLHRLDTSWFSHPFHSFPYGSRQEQKAVLNWFVAITCKQVQPLLSLLPPTEGFTWVSWGGI